MAPWKCGVQMVAEEKNTHEVAKKQQLAPLAG
jgi:hypothetical protein